MKVSQYNHICQVFESALLRYRRVFNSILSIETISFFKFMYIFKLEYALFVDIPVDKDRFLLYAIALRFRH